MKKLAVSAVVILALAIAACGGSGSSSNGGGGGTTVTTRAVKGTIKSPGAIVAKVAVSGSCTDYTPAVCKVIATGTDGSTVMDESLGDCTFSLNLSIGKDYVISFVGANPATGACDTFVATLLSGTGNVFKIGEGGDIDLGFVTVNTDADTATFSGSIGDSLDVLSCGDLGLVDTDSDSICDGWDGSVPGSEDFADVTACTANTDCSEGETCNEWGFCETVTTETKECTEDADCEALHPGEGNVCDTADWTCKAPTFSIADLEGSYARTSFEGAAGCETYINRMSEIEGVAVTGADLVMTGDDTTGGCNPETQPVTFTPTQTGSIFEAVSVLVRECPVEINDRQTNTITFDASATPITLVREITAVEPGNIQFPDPASIGCKGIYEKQP